MLSKVFPSDLSNCPLGKVGKSISKPLKIKIFSGVGHVPNSPLWLAPSTFDYKIFSASQKVHATPQLSLWYEMKKS